MFNIILGNYLRITLKTESMKKIFNRLLNKNRKVIQKETHYKSIIEVRRN